jgi:RNA polymerase sigma-70 factor (ECF subfamily)
MEAGNHHSAQADAALARLCQTYWRPLYMYVRRLGHGPEDAQDMTQEFFARLLAKDYLKAADREKGKFRSFLLMAMKRFLANEWDRANREKRGGGREIVSLDLEDAEGRRVIEPADERTPDKVFEQHWASALLEKVFTRLSAEMATEGKEKLFQELKGFLSGEKDGGSYPEAARRLDMSEGTLRVNVHRLRQRYRELLRLEVANTVDRPEAIDDEIRYLFAALA